MRRNSQGRRGASATAGSPGRAGAKGRIPDRVVPGKSLALQKSGKLRSLKNQLRGVERLLRKVRSWIVTSDSGRSATHRTEDRAALQQDLDPRARAKQEALLQQLKAAALQHEQAERERKYAVRYHKVGLDPSPASGTVRRSLASKVSNSSEFGRLTC